YIEAKRGEWRNARHAAQWEMTLRDYAAPIGSIPVDAIGTDEVLRCLKPIWTTKPETAARVRGRIENVLDAAAAKKMRTGENPARASRPAFRPGARDPKGDGRDPAKRVCVSG